MYWIHRAQQADPMAVFIDRSLVLAATAPAIWATAQGRDTLRGVLLETALAAARAAGPGQGGVTALGEAGFELRPEQSALSGDGRLVRDTVLATPRILAGGLTATPVQVVQTVTGEAAGWPLAIAVAAVVATGVAVAIVICADKAADVVDRKLARDADLAKLVQVHAQTLALVRQHQDREDSAGRPLPLDAATRAALAQLQGEQSRLSAPSSLGGVSSFLTDLGAPLLLGVAGLGALYYLSGRKAASHRKAA